jgi:hypothetical protein
MDSGYQVKAPWCSGNILAFGANVGGSNPPGAVVAFSSFFMIGTNRKMIKRVHASEG